MRLRARLTMLLRLARTGKRPAKARPPGPEQAGELLLYEIVYRNFDLSSEQLADFVRELPSGLRDAAHGWIKRKRVTNRTYP